MEKYRRQETVTLQCLFYSDEAKTTLADCDTATVSVMDETNQLVVTTQAMTKTATGTYQYYYTSGSTVRLGKYTADAVMTKGTDVQRPQITFEIVKEVA